MLIHLFTLMFSLMPVGSPLPNYFPSYASAREASKNMQKELVVFFSGNSCNTCESAWSAFTGNSTSSQHYVYTRLDIRDFDGSVFFKHFDFKQVPSWVILTPAAEVKEKWEGGWKDSAGNPTAFDLNSGQTTLKEETHTKSSNQNYYTPSSTKKPASPIPKESNSVLSSENSKPISSITAKAQPDMTSTGFYLQAGYFGSEPNAQKMIGDLKAKGYQDFKIEPVQKDGTTFYRVISQVYHSETDVNAEQQRLINSGFKTSMKK